MSEIKYPTKRTFWKATSNGVLHQGYTDPDQVTTTGQPTFVSNTDATTIYPALPSSGTLTAGTIYAYNGGMVQVVQTHERTIYPPEQTPALFNVFRANTTGLVWVANEKILWGDERLDNGVNYYCIQPHQTQAGQEPHLTPALWALVQVEFAEWVQPQGTVGMYQVGAKVSHNGFHWQSTAANNVWEPGVYGWVKI